MIPHPLTLTLVRHWMGELADAFSARTQDHVLTLVAGTLLTPSRCTVAAALRVMGLGQTPTFTSYHRVLNRNTWSSRDLARRLLLMLLRTLVPPAAPVVIGLDDTLERRRGTAGADQPPSAPSKLVCQAEPDRQRRPCCRPLPPLGSREFCNVRPW